MTMLLVSVEITRGRPGTRNLRYAAEKSALFAASKVVTWAGLQVSVLCLPVSAA